MGRNICHALVLVLIATTAGRLMAADVPVANPSFEVAADNGIPVGWSAWTDRGGDLSQHFAAVPFQGAPDGERILKITALKPQTCILSQKLAALTPGRWYEATAKTRCEQVQGHASSLAIEFWRGDGVNLGSIDSEALVGTCDWRTCSIRFQAPHPSQAVRLDCFLRAQSGTAMFDAVSVRATAPPNRDYSRRQVLDGGFWGMFTCFFPPFREYADDMAQAGVRWQRMGLGSTLPDIQRRADELGMVFDTCIDGMPPATEPSDPCYPVTDTKAMEAFLRRYAEKELPGVRIWECYNEPNGNTGWTLPGYINYVKAAAACVRAAKPGALIAPGGFAVPYTGYVEACLKRGLSDVVDVVLVHPYAVDEALDSHLVALARACERGGRPDIPVAINETGWATWDPATQYAEFSQFVSEHDQASYIVKLHVQALAHRVSFVAYLGWSDISPETARCDHSGNMGLVRVDGSPKPGLNAYRFMTETIGNRKIMEWSYADDGTRLYRLDGEPPLWITWNALQTTDATVDTGQTQVIACDMFGTRLQARPASGKVNLRLQADPIYLVPIGPLESLTD